MSIVINIYYKGKDLNARKFAEEMVKSGIVDKIRTEDGNEGYDYYLPLNDVDTVLLIDKWKDQKALDLHHASPMMSDIASLRDKYDLHMQVERYVSNTDATSDDKFIRK